MTQTPITPATPDALRAAIAEAVQVDAQQLQAAVGSITVATSDQFQRHDLGDQIQSLYDNNTRTLTLLSDRIPAGQEAQAFASALTKHLGYDTAVNLVGEEGVASARVRVYDIPNGYRDSAETMYRRLHHQGFTPKWDMGQREGEFMLGITIPQNETSQLRLLQKSNPATWGSHPEVEAMLNESKQKMAVASERRHARLGALTPDQREFIEVLHSQSKDVLHTDAALDVNDKLHELAAQHQRLAHISLSESGLSQAQERVRDDVESKLITLAREIPGVIEPKFMYDPRGTTVGLVFELGAHNSLNGSYKVPLNPQRVKELSKENFQAAIEALKRADQYEAPSL